MYAVQRDGQAGNSLPLTSLYATLRAMLGRDGWCIEERKGLRFYCVVQPEEMAVRDIFVQGVFARQGGVSQGPWRGLNVGHTVGDDGRAVEVNHHRICQALGISREAITTAEQVHGARVAQVKPSDCGVTFSATDGLLTDVRGAVLMLRFADCVPLLFFDPRRPAVGLAHAGWRGTLAGVATRMVESMQEAFGSLPEQLLVGIGPAIGPCCYEVGPDLADRVHTRFPLWPDLIHWRPGSVLEGTPGNRPYLNLWRANRRQLEAAGVRSVVVAQHCTACHSDEFYSHRAAYRSSPSSSDQQSRGRGQTGRFAAVIGLRAA
jgi:YfiH family protein